MTRPAKPLAFSPEGIVNRMAPGLVYDVSKIAGWFHMENEAIRPYLADMHQRGVLIKKRCPDNSFGYSRPKTVEEDAPLQTSVAGPPMPPNFASTINGYDAGLRRHMELAMTVRAR